MERKIREYTIVVKRAIDFDEEVNSLIKIGFQPFRKSHYFYERWIYTLFSSNGKIRRWL